MKKLKIIGGILIVIGIIVISSAIGMRLWAAHKEKAMINDFQKTIAQEDEKPSADVTADTQPPSDKEGVLGILTIPKINLKVAIGEGVDLSTLKYAVGHFTGTALPGQKGNFAVAGHRSYTYSEYFNRLGEIKNGDEIYVQDKKGTYTYKVYDISVVTPDHVEVLNPTTDATMTLVTCTPIRVATHRLIIKARLEKS